MPVLSPGCFADYQPNTELATAILTASSSSKQVVHRFVQSMLLLFPEGKGGEGVVKSHIQTKVCCSHYSALAHRARHFITAGRQQVKHDLPSWADSADYVLPDISTD